MQELSIKKDKKVINGHQRHKEKVKEFISWLLVFHHSTDKIILHSMGLRQQGQQNFLRFLKQANLVRYMKVPHARQRLVMLSPEGKRYALMLGEDLASKAMGYSTEPSKVAFSQLIHHLSVQKYVANLCGEEGDKIIKYMSTKTLDFAIDKGKKPDAVIEYDNGERVAIEIELTRKPPARVIRGYCDNIKHFEAGYYKKVIYVFGSESLRDRYQLLLEQDEWAIHKVNDERRLVATGDVFDVVNYGKELILDSFILQYQPELMG